MKISGQLPSSRNRRHSCVVKTESRKGVLYLRAKKREESKEGSLHLSLYGRDESFLGHLGISDSTPAQEWSSLPICPSRSENEEEKNFYFSGTPGLAFASEICQDSDIKLDETKPVEMNQKNRVHVFQFIPPQDISKRTQLDVTVTSDTDEPAYLKVSQDCKVVNENIRLVHTRVSPFASPLQRRKGSICPRSPFLL